MTQRHDVSLVEPCAYCGVPCLGTTLFACESNGVVWTVEIDSPTVSAMFESLWPVEAYAAMPAIFRDHNECRGWSGAGAESVEYEPGDLVDLIGRIRATSPSEPRRLTVLDALQQLSDIAIRMGARVALSD